MRLAVSGPQNTGKTTFIKDFLKAFPSYYSPSETYRDVIRKNNLKINRESTDESQRLIRDFLYKQIKSNKRKNILFDRCVLDNLIYSTYQFEQGNVSKKFVDETKKILSDSLKYLDALILIPTGVSVRLVEDNLRDTDIHFIDSVNRIFISAILDIASKKKTPKIYVVTGDRESRIKQVSKLISLC
jgi:hypothetical protein